MPTAAGAHLSSKVCVGVFILEISDTSLGPLLQGDPRSVLLIFMRGVSVMSMADFFFFVLLWDRRRKLPGGGQHTGMGQIFIHSEKSMPPGGQ